MGLDAGHIAPCGLEPSQWSSKAFPVVKGDGTSCRIVADFKRLNQYILRPHWPTESADQLLRHIPPEAKYFATMDLTSGYHQIPLDEESQNLLLISTPMGRFKYLVLAQGVYSVSDIFNYLTDGSIRYDGSESIKNMDDILIFGKTLKELEEKIEAFTKFCEDKNLKLKPSKMVISEEVEFAGTVVKAATVENEDIVVIQPRDKRIKAFL